MNITSIGLLQATVNGGYLLCINIGESYLSAKLCTKADENTVAAADIQYMVICADGESLE